MKSSKYFEGKAKGEIITLRDNLDSNDPTSRKNAARRVVNLMRSGENVSCLFSSMLRCVQTDDIQLKKLVYLYLVTYSGSEPEQSIMVVNTFIKDSEDNNPIIRALAVRSMCRIKVDSVAEYMIIPLKKCLEDKNAYVRKTAAIAVAKLYDVIPESVENSELLSLLQKLLYDENPMVVANTSVALLEINEKRSTPIFQFTEETISPIISATTQCSEWMTALLLDAMSKYVPTTSEEANFLIDRLIPFLKHSNSSVVIGSFRCIYSYLEISKRNVNELFQQIIPPFITLISSESVEIQFVVLRTLTTFVTKYPHILANEVRTFFCKYNDPSFIRMEKLEIILIICTARNVGLILEELEEYCNSVDVQFVKKTIRIIGKIAIKIPASSRKCIDILMKLVDNKADYAIEQSIVVISNLLRNYPGEFESIIAKVCNNIEIIKDPEAKSCLIWILGEYNYMIEKVDVLIDPFLDTFKDENIDVQIQLLSAIVKMYIENQNIIKDQLQFVLNEAIKPYILPDVRNRALIYWRLLTMDINIAKDIIVFKKEEIVNNEKISDNKVLDIILKNTGKVSGVLHIVPEDFVKNQLYTPEDDNINNVEDVKDNQWNRVYSDDVIDVFSGWTSFNFCLRVINKSLQNIGDFAIAFNKNIMGCNLDKLPSFPQQLEFGESFEISLPVKFQEDFVGNVDNTKIQIALKTSNGIKMFDAPFDLVCLISHVDYLWFNEDYFHMEWDKLRNEDKFQINDAKIADKSYLENINIRIAEDKNGILCVVFNLPLPNSAYFATLRQNGNNIQVVLRANESKLFPEQEVINDQTKSDEQENLVTEKTNEEEKSKSSGESSESDSSKHSSDSSSSDNEDNSVEKLDNGEVQKDTADKCKENKEEIVEENKEETQTNLDTHEESLDEKDKIKEEVKDETQINLEDKHEEKLDNEDEAEEEIEKESEEEIQEIFDEGEINTYQQPPTDYYERPADNEPTIETFNNLTANRVNRTNQVNETQTPKEKAKSWYKKLVEEAGEDQVKANIKKLAINCACFVVGVFALEKVTKFINGLH
ncbi:Adaptin N terminal region family protein [Histomonas meleagridis]|uniref:Adaptin N terminal region family protein n=1 Tax=Histomonas meleagridis TaxID=135588 RepID=UPI003559B861|nr:Adaptin N terminal region family protein [Histomonas meleagridis]KAH0798435.1 Adaptin N terminal region family protein [Histomonas meleagridis]